MTDRFTLRSARFTTLVLAFACVAPATAQAADLSLSAMLETDHRRRGLSWSDGDVSPSAAVSVETAGIRLGAGVAALRQSARHGGADAVIDIEGGYGIPIGPLARLDAVAIGHMFPGSDGMGYAEGGAILSGGIGPVDARIAALYAPSQSAIGGDNFHLSARLGLAIIPTGFNVFGGIGHSSGSVDNPIKAARLRPGGSYTDYHLGVDRKIGPLALGLTWTGTNIDLRRFSSPYADGRHAGNRLTLSVGLHFKPL